MFKIGDKVRWKNRIIRHNSLWAIGLTGVEAKDFIATVIENSDLVKISYEKGGKIKVLYFYALEDFFDLAEVVELKEEDMW